MNRKLFIILLLILFFVKAQAQTYTITHDVPFHTENQNMWGPNGSPFNLNFSYELFNVQFDTSMSFGFMQNIWLIGNVGAMFNMNLHLLLASEFEMYGWTTGWIDIDYPVRITYEIPNNYTFNPGEVVTIKTDYDVLPGWELYSHFPQAGVVSLDLEYGFGIGLNADVCLGGCTTIPIMNINVPDDSIAIFYLNGQTGEVAYPCYDPNNFPPFTICHDDVLPITFNNLFGIGLSGWITLPYIPTTDWLNTNDPCHQILGANGDSTYAYIELDIIQFLSFLAGFIPPPQGPAIQQFLQMLHGTYSFSIITIEYNLLSAYLTMTNTLQQDLTFTPTILTIFTFPTPVEYWVEDPHNGNQIVDQGVSDSIAFPTCMNLKYRYPCYGWPQMPIGAAAHLDNQFNNHVWDSMAFSFIIQALEFTITIDLPFKNEVVVPEFCLPLPNENKPDEDIEVCSPAILGEEFAELRQLLDSTGTGGQYDDGSGGTEPPQILDWTFHIGPLIDISLPLGYIPLTWYNNTWEMAGFNADTVFPGFVMIPNPEFQLVSITQTNNVCAGDSIGSITVTIANGTPPYTYTWSNGIVQTTNSTSHTISNLLSGTYSVTISDANGCSQTAQATIIETNPPINITLTPVHVLCHGQSTGIIYSQVTGGTPPYTYQWIPVGGNGPNATNLPAGTYTLSVVDAVGCPKVDSTTITEPPTYVGVTLDSVQHVTCFGGTNGYIAISAFDGVPPYTYLWSNGSTLQDLSNIPAGTYTVTVTDANGCTITLTETVNEPPLLAGFIMPTHVTCYGLSNGSANLIVAGGTPPYTYLWNTGSTSEDLNNIPTGTYSVTITDANGCVAYASTFINQPFAPLTATYAVTDVLCHGYHTGVIDLSPTGGTPPYSYQWNSGQTTQDLNNIPAGNYSVTITDYNGCTETYQMVVNEPPTYVSIQLSVTDVRCFGEINGAINLTISGGVPPYQVLWSNGASTEDINYLPAGYYFVTVTDSHGCTIVDSALVREPQKLYASITQNVVICINDTAHLYVSATGGTPGYTFTWNTGSHDTTINVWPTVNTNYSVTVTDTRGCISVSSTTVQVRPPLSGNIQINDSTLCVGEPLTFTGFINGGNGNYTITLNDTANITLPYTMYPEISSGYIIKVEDNCNTPPIYFTFYVSVIPSPPNNIQAHPTSGCVPLMVQFYESSPDEGQTYIWNFGDPNSSNISNLKNPVHWYNLPGEYTVSLTTMNEHGCKTQQIIPNLIKVYPLPESKFITDPLTVNMLNTNVHFINLSTGAVSYYWNFGDGDSSSLESPYHLYPPVPAEYNVYLVAISQHGCVDTSWQIIRVISDYTFYAPTAFSPDNDGKNEVWRVYATNINFETFHLIVYDRWGEVIFETTNIEKVWDGRIKGGSEIVPPGTYTWMAKFKDNNDQLRIKTGPVTVIY
ncbi:MAG: gliding motility-associated C-terminal domain-containing protein [Bacteroidales bacterium]|nr:gliding motility-associated C-terminal domain-containing protein [Bacteroidales bacterium]